LPFVLAEFDELTVFLALLPLGHNYDLASPGMLGVFYGGKLVIDQGMDSLRVVQNGGARLAPELRSRIRSQWSAIPQEIYGTAEDLINMTRLDDADDVLLHSAGVRRRQGPGRRGRRQRGARR
jgi:2,3-dihydroxybenzoate-AMP ligase